MGGGPNTFRRKRKKRHVVKARFGHKMRNGDRPPSLVASFGSPCIAKKYKYYFFLIFSRLFFQTSYKEGEYIVRQGAGGDTFFIISKGRVSCWFF